MPFIDIAERVNLGKGLLRGIEECPRNKFGAEGLEQMPKIKTAARPNDPRRIWTRKRRSKPTGPR